MERYIRLYALTFLRAGSLDIKTITPKPLFY
jgi:hypothetical protein